MTISPTLIQNSLRIGERLCASDLISMHQLQTALYEQELYEMMRLGEIMVLHGWVCQQTADFFGDQWPSIAEQAESMLIGGYLHRAGLIDRNQIETILLSQKKTGLRFGAIAILNGYIQQATLNFFIEQFFPDHIGESPYMVVDPDNVNFTHNEPFIVFDNDDQQAQPLSRAGNDGEDAVPPSTNTIHWLN
ncbi:hypothetical protein [Acaryochloris sp. IP29b_bin.137]|uniref:hypothetical protein n=1 Tax=Acaryochloris sp. IP29b_bin.137 TaxID=2969217 RepID=UPI002607310B|nr:hypothetical protein [Acaryochloris sp. IP29b_bin.137]